MIIYDSSLKIYYSTKINDSKFFSGFSTKPLGEGRNPQTVEKFLNISGILFNKIIVPDQVHGTNISFDPQETNGKIPKTDGLLTDNTGDVISVVTADCVPMVFADKKHGIVGISHQGWRGTIGKMSVKMVERMVIEGANIQNIQVAIGPAIGDCCYEIYGERYKMFKKEFPQYSDKIFRKEGAKAYLNLTLLNYLQLIDAGLNPENIDHFPFCTSCNREKFFSYRKDTPETFAEMFSFILRR